MRYGESPMFHVGRGFMVFVNGKGKEATRRIYGDAYMYCLKLRDWRVVILPDERRKDCISLGTPTKKVTDLEHRLDDGTESGVLLDRRPYLFGRADITLCMDHHYERIVP